MDKVEKLKNLILKETKLKILKKLDKTEKIENYEVKCKIEKLS